MYLKVWKETPFHSCPGHRSVVWHGNKMEGKETKKEGRAGKRGTIVSFQEPFSGSPGPTLPQPTLRINHLAFACLFDGLVKFISSLLSLMG